MSSDDTVIEVKNLAKCYEIYPTPRDRLKQLVLPRLRRSFGRSTSAPATRYYREFWALDDVSFQVRRGETLGIIGRNGSGKSTLLQILAGTMTPTRGEVRVNGRIAALLELGSGFNPEFTGRENVFLNGRILGLTQDEIEARYERITEFADIGDFIDQPVKTYSSGMFVRLAFAVQAHIDASIVIIDEALAVGDVFFRQKCYARLEQLRASGAAILLVSHSMPDIEQYCERALLLERGAQRFVGPASEAAKHYYLLHQSERPKTIVERCDDPTHDAAQPPTRQTVKRLRSDALLNMTRKPQVGTGQALCTVMAVTDRHGTPSNNFRQGEVAIFYFEFELTESIGIPVCGIVIANDRGIIVHGKNSWQTEHDVPPSRSAGSVVACRQEIELRLAPGEYTFEIGLAAVSEPDWHNRAMISHDAWAGRYVTVCVVTQAGHFSVGFANRDGVQILTHHGIADLPGTIFTEVR